MAEKGTDRATYAQVLKEVKAFRQKRINQPPLREKDFFYSKLDKETVRSYYRLKGMLKESNVTSTGIKLLVKKMPSHIWLLRKGVFEVLMVCGLLLVLFFYIKYVPIFKGYLPAFICFSGLSWFFLRRAIWNLNYKLSGSYHDLTETLEKELRGMKK